MTAHKAINAEVILYSYGIGTCYLAFFMLISGHLSNGYVAFSENPVESYGYAFIFSLTGYFGMQVVLSLVRAFGAFVAVTVTSMRKFLSIFLSFILFSKPFSSQYLFGGLVVMLGIYLNLASKSKVDFDAKWNRLMNYVLHIVKMIPYTSRKTPKRTSHV
jgi:adenosine 3'-phospho 5'-phosphosulfate transporter B3